MVELNRRIEKCCEVIDDDFIENDIDSPQTNEDHHKGKRRKYSSMSAGMLSAIFT